MGQVSVVQHINTAHSPTLHHQFIYGPGASWGRWLAVSSGYQISHLLTGISDSIKGEEREGGGGERGSECIDTTHVGTKESSGFKTPQRHIPL